MLDALLAEMQNEVFPNLFPKSKGRKFTGLPVITVLTKGLPYVNKIVLCYVKCCSSLPDFSGKRNPSILACSQTLFIYDMTK